MALKIVQCSGRHLIAAMMIVLEFSFAPSASAKTVYVSPDGTGDGSSAESPATLSASLLLGLDEGDTAMACAGDYTLTETLAMTNSAGNPIVLQGSGEKTVFRYSDSFSDKAFAVDAGTLSHVCLADSSQIASSAVDVSTGTIANCIFTNLTIVSTTTNAVVYAQSSARIQNSLFVDTLADSTILGNGTVKFTASDCTFLRHTSHSIPKHYSLFGGGIAIRCKFLECNLRASHAGLHNAQFYDCVFKEVSSSMYYLNRAAQFYNCTFLNNKALIWPLEGAAFYNSLFYRNTKPDGKTPLDFGSAPLQYCFLESNVTGDNRSACVIGEDPGLNEDLTLKAGSPCVDAGSTNSSAFPAAVSQERTLDLLGNSRLGFSAIDIGCTEKTGYSQGETFFNLSKATVLGSTGQELEIVGNYRADEGVKISVEFDFGDGSTSQLSFTAKGGDSHEDLSLVHSYAVGGIFQLSATVTYSNGNPTESIVLPGKFRVQNATSGDVFVSPTGNDLKDGLSRENAKATVESAIVAVRNGKVVLLNGKHEMGAGITVADGQVVEGESRDGTIVTSQADSTLFTLTADNSRIRNFTFSTITNNAATVYLKRGSVESVTFDAVDTGNQKCVQSDYGYYLKCTVTNCLFNACAGNYILGCHDDDPYATAVDTAFVGCKANNRLVQGYTKYRLSAAGCTTANYVFDKGGAVYDSLVCRQVSGKLCKNVNTYNCTFADNNVADTFNGGKHYNDIFVGNTPGVVASGEFYNCLYDDETFTTYAKDENCIYTSKARLATGYIPRNSSPAVGKGRYYSADNGTSVDTVYFPNAANRMVDLAGKARLRNGDSLDIGCYQALPLSGFRLVVR